MYQILYRGALVLSSILFISLVAVSEGRSLRVEPPFWWAGMEEPTLELMLHAERVADYEVRLDDRAGARLIKVEKADSPNYLFVTIDLKNISGNSALEFILKHTDAELSFEYAIKQRTAKSAARRGFDMRDSIYLITPDRFANGDTSNDSFEGMAEEGTDRTNGDARHGGDLKGIIDHIDYIEDLGFTQVWLNPVKENNEARTSYHGYAATDFYKIDPRYGSNADYAALSAALKARGMGLIMDVVPNHAGLNHWWTKDLPFQDWYTNGGHYEPNNHRRVTVRDPYAVEVDKLGFSDGWFWKTMPDLNQRNPHLARYLIQNFIWWIEYAGLSGLRVDTVSYPDPDFTTDWVSAVMREYPGFSIVGEEWSANPLIVSPWITKHGLPNMMDFPLHYALRQSFSASESQDIGALYEALYNDIVYPEPTRLVAFADNHDMDRVMTQYDGDVARVKLALAYLAAAPRIPQIYYGTEIGMQNDRAPDNHGVIRTDMPGGWAGDEKSVFTKKGLTETELELFRFVRSLMRWRKSSKAVHGGETRHYAPLHGSGHYVLTRRLGGCTVLLALNSGEQDLNLIDERYTQSFADHVAAWNVLERKELKRSDMVVKPMGHLIVEIGQCAD